MQRKWFIICCLLMLIPTMSVSAREVLSDDICIIAEDEVINGTVFAFCEELFVDGTINGDIFGATVRTVINGEVNGSIYMVGGQLDILGMVHQDIHYGGAVLRFNPAESSLSNTPNNEGIGIPPTLLPNTDILSTRSIKALTLSTMLYESTVVNDGLINVGYQLIMNGDVHDEVSFWGSTFIVNGRIDGNAYAIVGDPNSDSSQIETLLLPLNLDLQLINPGLIVGDTGEVTGLLSYRGPVEGQINGRLGVAPYYDPPEATVLTLDEPGFFTLYLEALGREFSTLFIIGVLVLFLANNFLQAPVANLRTRPFASMGVGLLGFLLSFPIVLIMLVLSLSLLGFLFIIGFRGVVIAIAFVLGLVNIGGVSIFYFVAIFVSRALVGLAIGRLILRVMFNRNDVDERRWLQYLALTIGVLIISILISMPIIGIIINAMALFLGLGAIMIVVLAQFERFRSASPSASPTWYSPSPAVIREHRVRPDMEQATFASDTDKPSAAESSLPEGQNALPAPGTQNLPEGFDWRFFED